MIISGFFEVIIITFIIIEVMLGHMIIQLIITGLLVLFVTAVAVDSLINLSYPRYYVVTDEKMISCYRGLFAKLKFISRGYDNCGSITVRKSKKGDSIAVFPKGYSEDLPFVFSGINTAEIKKVKQIIENMTT